MLYSQGGRGRRARRRARRGAHAARTRARRARDLQARLRRGLSLASPSCSCTATASRSTSGASRQLARAIGFTQVSVSHEVSPLMKLVGRGDTTVVDAYLSPILRRYVEQVASELRRRAPAVHAIERRPDRRAPLPGQGRDPVRPGGRHRRRGAHRRGRRLRAASSASTWAAPRPTCRTTPASSSATFETQVAGVRMRAPMMSIHTVAAGGGSILHFDGARYRVGPGLGRRQSRPRVLPPRRAAHRHRLPT